MIPQFVPYNLNKYASAVSKQIASGWIGPSSITLEFEQEIAKTIGCKYAVAVTSGTTALMVAIDSCKIQKEKTILFPCYTFLAGANASKYLGYNVKLVDIKEDTLSMDPDKIQLDCTTKAIIFVNHNGYSGIDLNRIKRQCHFANILLIEDMSQCLGLRENGIVGDVAVLSFSVPKLISTGQGGMVLTDREDIYQTCLQVRDHGDNWRKDRLHSHIGVNFKFNDILASLGLAQLKDIEDIKKRKLKVWNWYRSRINIVDFGNQLSWMVIYRSNKVDQIIESLAKHDIQAVRYYKPIHWNPPYQCDFEYPVAEKVYNELVYLPSSLGLKKKEVNHICDIILEIEGK